MEKGFFTLDRQGVAPVGGAGGFDLGGGHGTGEGVRAVLWGHGAYLPLLACLGHCMRRGRWA